MKALSALFTALAFVVSAAAQRVVSIGIAKAPGPVNTLNRRAGSYSQLLLNNLTAGGYYADVAVGTPPQNVTLIVDTGSSDVWLLAADSNLCSSVRLQQTYGPCLTPYTSSLSSSYQPTSSRFKIQYADGSGASGIYITDDLIVGGATISTLQMGLGQTSTINSGLMGVGYNTNEATRSTYPNIIDVFQSQGLIGTKAYSLYLNDLESSTGIILFGGIDTEKYIGSLKAVTVQPDSTGRITSFTVALTALEVADGSGSTTDYSSSFPLPVVLDSGTTLSYLPSAVTAPLYSSFHAIDDTGRDGTGLVYVDCGYLSMNASFSFQFGGSSGPIIRVPVDEFILDNVKGYVALGLRLPSLPFTDVCSFGVQTSSDVYLLGDTFLRSAYVVYDLTNNEIALAQSNLNSTKSNIVEIAAGATQIPNATGVASQVTVAQTATDIPGKGGDSGDGGVATVTVTASATNSGNAGARSVPAPNWEAVGVAAVAGLGMLAGGMIFAL